MTITSFQLVDNQTFLPADVSAGVIFTSPEQANGVGNDLSTGILLVAHYHDLQSSPSGAAFCAVVEGKSDKGQFYTAARQFEEFNLVGFQQRRLIMMLPNLHVIDQGMDDLVRVGGQITDQVSRQQGVMPLVWRVRVFISDPSSFFTSVRMSIYGQRFNELTLPTNFRGILVDDDSLGTLVTTEIK